MLTTINPASMRKREREREKIYWPSESLFHGGSRLRIRCHFKQQGGASVSFSMVSVGSNPTHENTKMMTTKISHPSVVQSMAA
jgi:hypothetical protein